MKNERTKNEFRDMSIVETKDFAATVVGRFQDIRLEITSPIFYRHQLNKFKEGDQVTVYVSTRRPKRTTAQNRYLWGVYYPIIASETGENDIERLHALFKGKFLTTGIVDVLGERVRMTKSTTELSKAEFSEFIMSIEGLTGIQAPPTDNYYL